MKLQLIPYWREAWRLWSVRLAAFGSILWAWFLAFPETAIDIWNTLPMEMKAVIPPDWNKWVTFAIFLLTLASRLIQQQKAQAIIEEKMTERVENGEVEKVTLYKPSEY
ncbi:MAG TPA: hypothetical protein VHK27_05585 [Gammaproteobacteria bacterium]|nr:hypothetical protein [Gammaproteobacteria bacterium]